MDTPEGNSRRSWSGPRRGSGPRGTAGGTRATVLGSLTIPGRPEQVATARAFVARTLSAQAGRRPSRPDHARPTQLWAAAIQPTPA
jgi:hypothetical protein